MRVRALGKIIQVSVLSVALIGAGALTSWKITSAHNSSALNTYPLLDPSVSNPELHQEIINFDPLRKDLKQYLATLNLSHSLYFEYLPNGVSIRDGDDNISQAASLMKTPLIMDLYKLSEQGKINLDSVSTVTQADINNDAKWGNPTALHPGDTLTLREAAKITLQYSDNTTLNVIKDRIDPLIDRSSDSFTSLDLPYSIGGIASNQQISISSRSYSSVLKCLYYSCFNTPQDSTQIINYLVGSAEPNRIVAGVGKGITVAHKVGSGNSGAQSDCGIIYYPGKPYLMCLMFFNLKASEEVNTYFQHASKMTYDYINTSK